MAQPVASLNRSILRLALPTILMNISIPLLGAVDTAVVGHLPEIHHLGAVSLGSLVFTMLYFAFNFFRMSTIGLAAQSFGAGDERECLHVLARALLLGVAVGAAIIALRGVIADLAFHLIQGSADVERHARVYFAIRVWAAPAAFILLVFQGWFYGLRNVAYPVGLMVAVNALNIGLDFLFVVGLGYTSDGVAWATLLSQWLGVVLAGVLLAWRYRHLFGLFHTRALLDAARLRAIVTLNLDIFIRTLALQASHLFFMAESAALGDRILAANTILVQMRHITAFALDGFATAAEVLVGAAVGRDDREQMLRAVRLSLQWGMGVGIVISLLYLSTSPWWPALFTSNTAVLSLVHAYLVWVILEPWISNVCFIMDGIYVGATASRTMRNAMVVAVFAVFLPLLYGLQWLYGNHGMWAATVILYAVRSAALGWPLLRLHREPGYRLA